MDLREIYTHFSRKSSTVADLMAKLPKDVYLRGIGVNSFRTPGGTYLYPQTYALFGSRQDPKVLIPLPDFKVDAVLVALSNIPASVKEANGGRNAELERMLKVAQFSLKSHESYVQSRVSPSVRYAGLDVA